MPEPPLTPQEHSYAAMGLRALAAIAEKDAERNKGTSSAKGFVIQAEFYRKLSERCDRLASAVPP